MDALTAYVVRVSTDMVVLATDAQTARGVALTELAKRSQTGNNLDIEIATMLPHIPHGEARVGKDKLNLRDDHELTAPILGQLVPGEVVSVYVVENGWAIVQSVTGLTGWVATAYMTLGELVA